jgi:hypothetical protein
MAIDSDQKAEMLMVPFHHGICLWCGENLMLKDYSYRTDVKSKNKPMTQISELVKVHLDFMKCMTDFENDQKQKVGGTFYLGVKREHLLNDFKHTSYFQDFQAIWGDKYTGSAIHTQTSVNTWPTQRTLE